MPVTASRAKRKSEDKGQEGRYELGERVFGVMASSPPGWRSKGSAVPPSPMERLAYTLHREPKTVTLEGIEQMFHKYLSKSVSISLHKAYGSQPE